MLLTLRDGAGRWFVWVVIVLLIIALGLWGISSYFMGGGSQTPPVAKINGESIFQGDLQDAYNRVRHSQPKLFTAPDAPQKIKQQLLENLINEEILYQAAVNDDFSISTNQINGFITQIPAFQENGQFSQGQFNMVLNRMMFTPEQFMQNLKKSMLINQVRNGVVSSSFVLPAGAKQFVELLNQKRDLGYMIIPASRFVTDVKVSPKEVASYYQSHIHNYQTAEKVSINYIQITPKMVKESIKPSAEVLHNFYENNIANYTVPARWHVAHILLNVPANATEKQINEMHAKLAKVRAKAKKGASFASLAKTNSQDIITANDGGVMPWFSAGSLGPVFENTVASLKPGEISEPIQTRYGMEIIKLLAIDKQKVKPYSTVASQIKSAYISQQLQKQMVDKNDALANDTFENPNSLASAAKQLSLQIKTTPLFTRKGAKSGLLNNANIVATAFSDDVLQQSNNSDVLTLADGTLLVLRVNKHVPATELPLKQVTKSIESMLQNEKTEKLAENFANKIMPQITSLSSAKQAASKNRLQWNTQVNVSRANKKVNPAILQQVFTMPGPLTKTGLSVAGLKLASGDYVIVGVSKVSTPTFVNIPLQERVALREQAEATMATASYSAYMKMAKDNATVKMYSANLN